MVHFIRSRMVHYILLAFFLYWMLVPFLPDKPLATALNGVVMALWIGIIISYSKGTWEAVRNVAQPLGARMLLTGWTLISVGLVLIYSHGWWWRYTGALQESQFTAIRGFWTWIMIVGTSIVLLAGNLDDVNNKRRDEIAWRRLGVLVPTLITLTLVIVYLLGGFV